MAAAAPKTLVGWKAIAGYFSRDERTVMRWAATRGMPVQRVAGQARSSVYAWPDDLDAWLRREPGGRDNVEETVLAGPGVTGDQPDVRARPIFLWPRLIALATWRVAAAAALLLAGLAVAAVVLHRLSDRDVAAAAIAPAGAPVTFSDPAARASFLQASFDWNLRTRAGLDRAIDEYGRAIARDPGVASAYVGLANSYLELRRVGGMPDAEAFARATAAARVAATLSPNSAEAKRALGAIAFWWRGDAKAAGRLFRAALVLAPSDALTHRWYADALAANGEMSAALREIAAARALEPGSVITAIDDARIGYAAGQRDAAHAVLRGLSLSGQDDAAQNVVVAEIALYEGRVRDYLVAAARAAALSDDAGARAQVMRQAADFARGGAPLMFQRMVEEARSRTLRTNTGFFRLAQVSAIAGRDVAAIDALAPACAGTGDPAAVAAPGDLWLQRSVPRATTLKLCRRATLE